ncbi:hypothetical protein GUJ93_ZPchr0006g41529 [Zizania palustris]|uniref:Uncharacterized protein n=1 Tax=Zizania palustris TaxID=103762 RepID=A0A8J5W4Y9_ZIZPA|nr:hypothetical protein GUJ93_ZPchr0006g41529 [Zizania palustris]
MTCSDDTERFIKSAATVPSVLTTFGPPPSPCPALPQNPNPSLRPTAAASAQRSPPSQALHGCTAGRRPPPTASPLRSPTSAHCFAPTAADSARRFAPTAVDSACRLRPPLRPNGRRLRFPPPPTSPREMSQREYADILAEFLRESGGAAVIDDGPAMELEDNGADLKNALWSAKCLFTCPNLIRKVRLLCLSPWSWLNRSTA